MERDRRADVRSKLMTELDWPVTTGEVVGAAETLGEPDVAEAAKRLRDDATWLEIDELWDDLLPSIESVEQQ